MVLYVKDYTHDIMHWACWYSLFDDAIDFLFENNEGKCAYM